MSKNIALDKISPGKPLPFGTTTCENGINFAIFSRHAAGVSLSLSLKDSPAENEIREIELSPEINKTGDIWHICLHFISGYDKIYYGYKITGPRDSALGFTFSSEHILLDPYAKKLAPRNWGTIPGYGKFPCCLIETDEEFDWDGDISPKIKDSDTIIYELHVRGFTKHKSSDVKHPGTFLGLTEKIPYLKHLGVTTVELLPVTAWDETDNRFRNPESGEPLINFWGYNPVSYFTCNPGFAAEPENSITEFKTMVKSLHKAGIEVILDMVFNHSGESDYEGKTTSFRGIDNTIYYLTEQDTGEYLNFSGCGNTLNCNHPVVTDLIRESLRYWVCEMHVDGFRFDLASVFSRDTDGNVIADAPLIEAIAEDPVLRDVKIIAEAWDATGLYQVGSFSNNCRWKEWNGRFRDDIRMFMAGYDDTVRTLATRLAGSSDIYEGNGRGPLNSINFITSHDGFTLRDLVSYEQKNNQANGEDNRDGDNHNLSWNSGCEGFECSQDIEQLRMRRMKTFAALLLLSQGIPMITAGDEFGRTQLGNNNSWCQDNQTSWLDWSSIDRYSELFHFFRACIHIRKTYKIFRRTSFFPSPAGNTPDEITWQSLQPGKQDWSSHCHTLAFSLREPEKKQHLETNVFFIMLNGNRTEPADFTIPAAAPSQAAVTWRRILDSSAPVPYDSPGYEDAVAIRPGAAVSVQPMTLQLLQAKL